MPDRRPLLPGLLLGLVVGCHCGGPVHTTAWLDRFRGSAGPAGDDVVLFHVALVERPVGDPWANGELWAAVDEQVVAPERKAVLDANGFRVGQLGGNLPPAKLTELLTSERTGANGRVKQVHVGQPLDLPLAPLGGPKIPRLNVQIPREGEPLVVDVESADCFLSVVPSRADGGRVRLHVTPVVKHGESQQFFRAAADGTGWVLGNERPTEDYAPLGWEVTLGPNDFLVVGGCPNRPESLGCQAFVRRDEAVPVQRLLVLRTARRDAGVRPEPEVVAEQDPDKPPTLAVQAARTAAPAR
jgi:hypothetical protein